MYPCSLSWTLSRLLLFSLRLWILSGLQAMKPNITTGRRQAPVVVPSIFKHGHHSIFCRSSKPLWNTFSLLFLEPSMHQVLCHTEQEGCSFSSVCSIKSSEADIDVDYSVTLSALQPNGVGWMPLDVEARWSSESLPPSRLYILALVLVNSLHVGTSHYLLGLQFPHLSSGGDNSYLAGFEVVPLWPHLQLSSASL